MLARHRGFKTLDAIWEEAERRGWAWGTNDNLDRAVWMLDAPGYEDLRDRVKEMIRVRKLEGRRTRRMRAGRTP